MIRWSAATAIAVAHGLGGWILGGATMGLAIAATALKTAWNRRFSS